MRAHWFIGLWKPECAIVVPSNDAKAAAQVALNQMKKFLKLPAETMIARMEGNPVKEDIFEWFTVPHLRSTREKINKWRRTLS